MARYAGIDIGSNSIRLLIADAEGGRIVPVHTDREVVRLGSGVFTEGRVSDEAAEAAAVVLARMAAAIDAHAVDGLRVVGTSALRDAANRSAFVRRASTILRAPVEIISGTEEARLVDRGVRSAWPHVGDPALIVDVGGGSAQVTLSNPGRVIASLSWPLGAVRLTERFEARDPLAPEALSALRRAIRETIGSALEAFARPGLSRIVATSATAGAVVCAAHGIPRGRRDEADRLQASAAQVSAFLEAVAPLSAVERARIPSIGRRRAEVIVAGVAVLDAVLTALGVPALAYSTAGVRDGLIADLADDDEPDLADGSGVHWPASA